MRAIVAFALVLSGGIARSDDDLQRPGANEVQPGDSDGPHRVADESSDSGQQEEVDASTSPFEFRSSNPQWPIVPASDQSDLSVRVRRLPEYIERDLVLLYQLIRVDDGAVVGQEQTDLRLKPTGDSESISIASQAPVKEGVYEIRCRLFEKPDRIWSRLTRARGDLASVKTPLLIYNAESNQPPMIASPPDRALSLASDSTRQVIQNVERVDPDDWQTPAWIPDRANSIVPNVKRVSDSLTLNPWREGSGVGQHRLAPGESFVGWLPNLSAHQPFQIRFTIGQNLAAHDQRSSRPPSLRIEFSDSPDFQSKSQASTLTVQRQIDLAEDSASTSAAYDLLHYPAADSGFIRLTNESSGKTLTIDSITLAAQQDVTAPDGDRRVTLRIDSSEWIEALSSDYWELRERGEYAESTVQFFKLWKSISRLPFHARWCGYSELIVGRDRDALSNDSWLAAEKQSDGAPMMRRTARMQEAAYSLWIKSNGAPLTTRSITDVSKGVGDAGGMLTDSSTESEWVASDSAPSFQMLDLIARKNPGSMLIRSSHLPLVIGASYREALEDFKWASRPSVEMSSVPDSGSDHVCVLIGEEKSSESGLGVKIVPVTIINTAPWSGIVRFGFSAGPPGEISIRGDAMNKAVVIEKDEAETRAVSVPPSSIINLNISGGSKSGRLKSWQASMAGSTATLEALKSQVSDVIGKIGTLALPEDYDELRNGGFEVAGKVGIVGWMHTQFPSTAVMLDSEESIEGSHSIRMTADSKSAGRTWLVSEPIPVPGSGRLAVSLATRANVRVTGPTKDSVAASPSVLGNVLRTQRGAPDADATESLVHRIRVSLEGIRLGKPIRFVSEFGVPCDGHWQPRRIVLETDQVVAAEISSLRLTIDSLSPGKLWIDDVHLHDQFPTQAERTAMQGRAFLAVQGLQHGHFKPAAQLLQNDWSKYLLDHSPRKSPPRSTVASRNRSASSRVRKEAGDAVSVSSSPVVVGSNGTEGVTGDPPAAGSKRESVADRIRDWLPRPIRF